MPNNTQTEHNSWLSNLLGQILAYSSILLALSYLFGRSFFKGYFDALGIDMSFIDLSVYEYLEKGWLFLWRSGLILTVMSTYILFALIIYNLIVPIFNKWVKQHKKAYFISVLIMATGFLALINLKVLSSLLKSLTPITWLILIVITLLMIGLLVLFRKSIKNRFFEWIELLKSDSQQLEKVDNLFQTSEKVFLQFLFFIVFLFIFYSSSSNAKELGYKEGISYLKTSADIVELTSSSVIPQLISSAYKVPSSTDLRFLYFNNGHYFISKFGSNCKPEEQWVIDESNVESVRMIEPTVNLICP